LEHGLQVMLGLLTNYFGNAATRIVSKAVFTTQRLISIVLILIGWQIHNRLRN